MDTTAVAEVLARPWARRLLASSVPARLAYTGLDGDPRVVPVAFGWDGSRVTVCTVVGSAKVPALRRHPRVALTIDTEGFPPKVLLVRGAVEVEVVEGVPQVYVEASRRLVPPEAFDGWEAGVRALYDRMAVVTITPDRARLLDFETTLPRAVQDVIDRKVAEGGVPG
jgi:hypothetical protein